MTNTTTTTRPMCLLIAAVVTALALCSPALAEPPECDYYVSTNGVDTNTNCALSTNGWGTHPDCPFATLTYAIGHLASGDTLCVMPGTYDEEIINVPAGISDEYPTTIRAYNSTKPVIMPSGYYRALTFYGEDYHHIVLDGLIFDGSDFTQNWCLVRIDHNSTLYGHTYAHHVTMQDCEVRYGPSVGICIGGNNNQVLDCDVHSNGLPECSHGIYLAGDNNLVEGCSLHGNTYHGVKTLDEAESEGDTSANSNGIVGNEVYNNGHGEFCGSRGSAIMLADGDGNYAIGNIVHDNAWGIQLFTGNNPSETSCGSVVRDNLIYDNFDVNTNAGWGILVQRAGVIDAEIQNNIIYGNDRGIHCNGTNTQIVNNTIYNNYRHYVSSYPVGLRINYPASGTVVQNNIVYGNEAGIVDLGTDTTIACNYTDADASTHGPPRFVNTNGANTDLHLQSDSPCINAGCADGVDLPDYDFDGDARVQECVVDIGADETSYAPDGLTILSMKSCRDHGTTERCLEVDDGEVDPRYLGVTKLVFRLNACAEDVSSMSIQDHNTNGYAGDVTTSGASDMLTVTLDPRLGDESCWEFDLSYTGGTGDSHHVATLQGDANRDRDVTSLDYSTVQLYVNSGQPVDDNNCFADLDVNGDINSMDYSKVTLFLANTAPTCP